MRTKPGGVQELVEIAVPRPRSPSQFLSPEFLSAKQRLEDLIHPQPEKEDHLPIPKITEEGDDVE